jgi:hypothetical protein
MAILAISTMAKVASADEQSPVLWGGLTAGMIMVSFLLIPWPFARVGIAFTLVLVGMFMYKVLANR